MFTVPFRALLCCQRRLTSVGTEDVSTSGSCERSILTTLRSAARLTRDLHMQIAEVKPPLGFRPGVEAGFRLLHDVSFFGQPAVRSSHVWRSPLGTAAWRL